MKHGDKVESFIRLEKLLQRLRVLPHDEDKWDEQYLINKMIVISRKGVNSANRGLR